MVFSRVSGIPCFKDFWHDEGSDNIVSTIQADQPRGLSQMFDEKFDEAYDISVKENDLPHVKWGRVDYITVTALTTKWAVWQ
jgi:hypothetical protein